MCKWTRAAALAAVVLVGQQTASAGFVYQFANRAVGVAVNGSAVDSDATGFFGAWYGSASSNGAGYTVLSTEGSELIYSEMTFVGAAQISGANQVDDISATSGADVVFLADATESISWILGLGESASGASSSAVAQLIVTDVTTGTIRLAASSDFTGSGSFGIVAGHFYRVAISATTGLASSGETFANYNAGFFSIPAPGAAALTALAALVGVSRRR